MARHSIYLKNRTEDFIKSYAQKFGIETKDALKMIIETSTGKSDDSMRIAEIENKLTALIITIENLLPEIHFLSATTRSSLLGKSENPLLDGDLAAQKSRRFLASLLKDITPSFEERLEQ